VSQRERAVVLVVSDDGRGFGGSVREDGLGLIGMRERVALLGGHLTVDSTEGAGTMLTAELPIP
jgi:two-component system sensor histidine kinase DegS